jgi:hypothetical protein
VPGDIDRARTRRRPFAADPLCRQYGRALAAIPGLRGTARRSRCGRSGNCARGQPALGAAPRDRRTRPRRPSSGRAAARVAGGARAGTDAGMRRLFRAIAATDRRPHPGPGPWLRQLPGPTGSLELTGGRRRVQHGWAAARRGEQRHFA